MTTHTHPKSFLCGYLNNKSNKPNLNMEKDPKSNIYKATLSLSSSDLTIVVENKDSKICEFEAYRQMIWKMVEKGLLNRSIVPVSFQNTYMGVVNRENDVVGGVSSSVMAYSNGDNNSAKKKALNKMNTLDDPSNGNWNINNSKERLYQYFNKNKITPKITLEIISSSSSIRSRNPLHFMVMSFQLPNSDQILTTEAKSPKKKEVSKICARNLMHQLFRMGLVEAAIRTNETDITSLSSVPTYQVCLNSDLITIIRSCLSLWNKSLIIPIAGKMVENDTPITSNTLLEDNKKLNFLKCWKPPSYNNFAWKKADYNVYSNYDDFKQSSKLIKQQWNIKQESIDYKNRLKEKENLAVCCAKDIIYRTICDFEATIIRSNSSCGKTTQVPQIILENYIQSDKANECCIVVVVDNDLLAITHAKRVAYERVESLGESVGYCVTFSDCFPREHASILYCTPDSLIRNLKNGFTGISHLIIDNIHQRHIMMDLMLLIAKKTIDISPLFRVICLCSSANMTLVQNYFCRCYILDVNVKLQPLKTFFLEDCIQLIDFNLNDNQPISDTLKQQNDDISTKPIPRNEPYSSLFPDIHRIDRSVLADNCNRVVDANAYTEKTRITMAQMSEQDINIKLIYKLIHYIVSWNCPGSILILLPSCYQIYELCSLLYCDSQFNDITKYKIIQLHSNLPSKECFGLFEQLPNTIRKIIVSTNIADNSMMMDDIVFLIDSCREFIHTESNSLNLFTKSELKFSSKSSLSRRSCLCVRSQPGYCFRLCSRTRYALIPDYNSSEIFYHPLDNLILTLKYIINDEPTHSLILTMVQPPSFESYRLTLENLKLHNFIDSKENLTSLGHIAYLLPLEPIVSKMVILGSIFGLGDTICTLAASLRFDPPFIPYNSQQSTIPPLSSFHYNRFSDPIAVLLFFDCYQKLTNPSSEYDAFVRSYRVQTNVTNLINKAKNKIISILKSKHFPDSSFLPFSLSYDPNSVYLDLLQSLLSICCYPNYFIINHSNNKTIYEKNSPNSIISKSSIISLETQPYLPPTPLFVFHEKVITNQSICKRCNATTILSFILFTKCKIFYKEHTHFIIDDWWSIQIDPFLVGSIISMRNLIDDLILYVIEDPKIYLLPTEKYYNSLLHILNTVLTLSSYASSNVIPFIPTNMLKPNYNNKSIKKRKFSQVNTLFSQPLNTNSQTHYMKFPMMMGPHASYFQNIPPK